MKSWFLAAMMISIGAVAACSSSKTTTGAGGAGGEDPGTSTATSTSSSGNTTGTGTTGTGTATSTGTGTTDCGDLSSNFTDPACATCADGACCAQMAACSSGTECYDLLVCYSQNQCADQACIDTCNSQVPGGVAANDALNSCLDAQCSAECGGGGQAAICDSGFALPADQQVCADCLGTNCCQDFTDCFNDTNCNDCLINQVQASCDATQIDEAIDACFTGTCAGSCG